MQYFDLQRARADFAENMTRWLGRFVEELSAGGLPLHESDTDTLVLGDGPAFLSQRDCLDYRPVIDTHASFKPPVSVYLPK